MIKIFHVFGNKVNLGDWGSAQGIHYFLNLVSKEEINFTDWHISYGSNDINEELISKINKEYDAMIIGGGGLFKKTSKYFDNEWTSGLLINISKKNLQDVKVPIFIYAIGLNQDYSEKKKLLHKNFDGVYFNKKQIDSIESFVSKSELFSVRDIGSQEFVDDLNISKKVYLTPCPSMFLDKGNLGNFETHCPNQVVGMNIHPNIPPKFRKRISDLGTHLTNLGFEIKILSHTSQQSDNLENIENSFGWKYCVSKNPLELMNNYLMCDITIGMRGHSNIFSFGANKPFIPIGYNIKNALFAKMVGMDDYLLRFDEKWSTEDFMSIFCSLIERQVTIKNHFKDMKSKYEEMNLKFSRQLIKKI